MLQKTVEAISETINTIGQAQLNEAQETNRLLARKPP
jgi:hypothetical protein